MELENLDAELQAYLASEPRQDPSFRYAIAMSQLGPLVSHMTHDSKENPLARPYGTRAGEVSDFGHAMLQLMLYGISRGISLQESIETAIEALRDRDWKRRGGMEISRHGTARWLRGEVAHHGAVTGTAFVDPHCVNLANMPDGYILVAVHPTTRIAQFVHKFRAIVTDHGGISCHAAIIAREFGIPCIVGTSYATAELKTGDTLVIEGGVIKR